MTMHQHAQLSRWYVGATTATAAILSNKPNIGKGAFIFYVSECTYARSYMDHPVRVVVGSYSKK